MGSHPYITGDSPRGKAQARVIAAIKRAWPDKELHYVLGGFVIVPRGTPVTAVLTLDGVWERLMTGPSPADAVAGSVVHDELTEGPP
jgi:hypothetical protein